MMSQRTVITGGVLVTDSDEIRADLVIDDHEIVAMLADAEGVDADEHIDASDLLVLPAAVDTYFTASRFGGNGRAGDSIADQRAAAAGGVTTLISDAGNTLAEESAQMQLAIDVAHWFSIPGGQLPTAEQLARMAQTGIAGFSASMRPDRSPDTSLTDVELLTVMKMLARQDVPLTVSPMHDEIDVTDPLAELAAVNLALLFAEQTGAWLHFRFISTAESMRQIVEARTRGVRVTATVSALHLTLGAGDANRSVSTVPPLRPRDTIDELWPYVLDESVDCIGSIDVRRRDNNGNGSGAAFPDIQTALSIFWDQAVNERGMSRSQAVRMLSTNPAQIAGVHPRKGTSRIGTDADLVLFDPLGVWTARHHDVLSAGHWTAYEGREVSGFVVRTLRRGVTVYDAEKHDDETLLVAGSGELLMRETPTRQ